MGKAEVKKSHEYLLPNGEKTTSTRRYSKDWKDFNLTLECALDMKVLGTGDFILVGYPAKSGGHRGMTDIPLHIARKIVELYENRCTCEPQWGD